VIDNQNNFRSGLEVHVLNTRSKNQLYLPTTNLSVLQKGATFSGIRLFNSLPGTIQSLRNDRVRFKITCFHISWLIHFILLLNSWNIQ
jgi:hypothetical protein